MLPRQLAPVLLLALAGCGEHRSVPKESCASVKTGRTETTVQFICAGYNKDGACTVQVPQYITHQEVVTTCRFTEWR